ncbi:trigger factor [Jeotgalicoccus sp. FSL K6-3177]|uniref:trigger factor n=1 Tax=Jeotgalicoccus sp. FSL K6-3177 TaxID=2921494 RepID=UPI0030FDA631
MSQTWEKQEGNEGILTITIPAEELNTALDEAFKKVSKDINMPGFRKGKVPRQMFEKRFGVESLYQDALDILLPENYAKAVDEAGITPVAQPDVDVEQIEKGKDVILKATVTVEPEVKLGEYKNLEGEEIDTDVTDEEVDHQIDHILTEYSDLVVKEEGTVEEGDIATIDFHGFVDGEAFEGGHAHDYEIEVGSNSFIPGFEEQMVGMEIGEEKDVNVTFPEEYHAEELAGKEAVFQVKVNSLKQKETPELTDEFVSELENRDAKTVDELKAALKDEVKAQKENNYEVTLKESLVAKAADNADIDVPDAMVDTETSRMLQEFEQNLSQQGLNLELYTQLSGQDENGLREQMKEDALKRVRTNLTLRQIAEEENIEVTDEDVDAEINRLAEQFGMPADDVKKALGDATMIKEDVKIQKALNVLVDNRKKAE